MNNNTDHDNDTNDNSILICIYSAILCLLMVSEYIVCYIIGSFSITNIILYWLGFGLAWYIIYKLVSWLDKKFKIIGTAWALVYFLIPSILLYLFITFL